MAIIKNQCIVNYLNMLNDGRRNKFFKDALDKHAPNNIVLDVGTGTGLLSFYALAAGAKFVYAIEDNPQMADIAEQLLANNFARSRFKIINGNFWSKEIDQHIQHKIDVLVSETVGPGLFDQGMIHTWSNAKLFIGPDAVSIPDRLACDLWIWFDQLNLQHEVPVNPFVPQPRCRELHEEECLDKEFSGSLIHLDQKIWDQRTSKKIVEGIKMHWCETNSVQKPPDLILQNVISYAMHDLPSIQFSDDDYPKHIRPKIEFEFDLDRHATVAIVKNISFESQTMVLKDSEYMPWRIDPFFICDLPGKYRCTYNNFDLKKRENDEWTCKRL